jgi:hypothetical protein
MLKHVTVTLAAVGFTLSLASAPAEAATWHKFTAPVLKGVSTTGAWARTGAKTYKIKLCTKDLTKDRRRAVGFVQVNGFVTGQADGENFVTVESGHYGRTKCVQATVKGSYPGKVQHAKVVSRTFDRVTEKTVKGVWKKLY